MLPVFVGNARAQTNGGVCSVKPVASPTFVSTNHLLDLTEGFGVTPTKDGGYTLTGDTQPADGMGAPMPYIIKTDAKGALSWSRWLSSQSAALGAMSSRRKGRLTVETTDGYLIMANDVIDFVDEETKEEYGDILITKLNAKGKMSWSLMLGDYRLDRPQKLWALQGGGVLLLGSLSKTGYGQYVADNDTVPRYSALIQIDKNGKVVSTKKMDWEAEDMDRLTDGSFIAIANLDVKKTEQPEHVLGSEGAPHALPTIIKLDKNINVVWAKSMEMIPLEINAPTSYSSGTFAMGKTSIRMPGGDFRAVKSTPDGGYIAFGFDNLALTQGFAGPLKLPDTVYFPRSFIAVKVDGKGNYVWTKKLTTSLIFSTSANDFLVTKTFDDQFVIMEDVIRDSVGIAAKSKDAGQKRKAFNNKCEQLRADCPDTINVIPEIKPFGEADNEAMNILSDAQASNIELIKTDADFNPRWIKKFDIERSASGYGIAPTADKGVVISASILTTKQHMTLSGLAPYKEGVLIKIDVNGAVDGCIAVSDQPEATVEDQSQYLIMRNMDASTGIMKLKINKKVPEKITTITNIVRNICKYQKKKATPICSYLIPVTSASGVQGQTETPSTAKTLAMINYQNTKEVAVEGDKNTQVNTELLPILKAIFLNQVKIKDSMKGMWLTYILPRTATRADVETVQKKYEELGYKIDESIDGNLWVSKIGLTLHMTFYILNSMIGKLEVLF